MFQSSISFYLQRWWVWLILSLISVAAVFASATMLADPITKKIATLVFSSVAGILMIVYALGQHKSTRFRDLISSNISPLLGVALLLGAVNLVVWKFVELPILNLVATPGEAAIYAGLPPSGDLKVARPWVDALHTIIVFVCDSPLLLAPIFVITHGLNSAQALILSIRAFAANWLLFLVLAIAQMGLHTFIQEPAWVFAIQAAMFIFVVAPIFTILGVIMADRICPHAISSP